MSVGLRKFVDLTGLTIKPGRPPPPLPLGQNEALVGMKCLFWLILLGNRSVSRFWCDNAELY